MSTGMKGEEKKRICALNKLKKLRSEWIRALQTTQKTTTLKKKEKKSWLEDGRGKERQKVALRRAALQHPKQNKQHCTRTDCKNGQREEKKHSNAK